MIADLKRIISRTGFAVSVEMFVTPPDPKMGDVSLPCFDLAKAMKKNPSALAQEIKKQLEIENRKSKILDRVEAKGPYVNFFLNARALAEQVLKDADQSYGQLTIGKKKKYLVEFGCPNPLKVFHLGHLKNLVTGESIARILEHAGFTVVRVNYQGDVGMHIAKALYGLLRIQHSAISIQQSLPLEKRIKFLGEAYAAGARAFEESAQAKKEIVAMNKRVYEKDPEIQEWYQLAVAWSLEYFDQIYARLGTRFDRLYMESEVSGTGERIVREHLKGGVFKKSDGAIIYEGSAHGLHDRVFINSEGFPTYEAKDLGLAQAHFSDYDPDRIIHVVGKEQTEYFKVVFKAIGDIWPKRAGKEFHLPGGFLQLKDGKMSSRTGKVAPAEELLALAVKEVREIMKARELAEKESVIEKVALSAVKYAILKVGVSDDVAFDLKSSVSFEGDSGPYLLYTAARINSIVKKATRSAHRHPHTATPPLQGGVRGGGFTAQEEKLLLLLLARFPDIVASAATANDPSLVCKYLFDLAKSFAGFYEACPVLAAEAHVRASRLALVKAVGATLANGLRLLGIPSVKEM